ncbi:MAG: cytochrome C oxidase subunit IV family protein [Planctomycetota bacterium]|nr:cytochrome C oxidase subunit IV family protein [Planctomycetota bacterium]
MHHNDETKPGYDLGHPMDMKILIGVFVALLGLTWLTVFIADLHLGEIDLAIALVIATVKATLVAVFFMHLSHDKGVNVLFFLGSVVMAALFLAVALGDTHQYADDVTSFQEAQADL